MKRVRQDKIVELIDLYDIETQEELAERLNQSGFAVTQATISRDIRELKLTKAISSSGKQKYIAMKSVEFAQVNDKYTRILKDGLVEMDAAQNILVLKTVSGMAMAVAAALDAMKMNEIVGCIAGDDTIMAAIRSNQDTQMVIDKITEMIR
ncbi:MAG: arginine repressor [Eubacteriales bacterium]